MSTEIKEVMARAKKPGTFSGLKQTDVMALIGHRKAEIAQALPKHVTAERVIAMASTVIAKSPALAECSIQSVIGAIVESSVLGFKPSNALAQCYFVPYKGHCQFQIGYRGWIELARRSGQVQTLYAHVVRDGDAFDYQLGLSPDLKHVPQAPADAAITHAYAVCRFKDGSYQFDVMTKDEIERLRKRNPSQGVSPSAAWATDYAEMAKAKVVKRLAKYLPLTDEIQSALAADEGIIGEGALSTDGSGIIPDGVQPGWDDYEEVNTEADGKE